ncbi:MAG TPA: L,D-transpeptidase family protein [Clostridiaceae bacterium]|nr:L,D-transpeptidase family protein [Clostridiaceae bacterium]
MTGLFNRRLKILLVVTIVILVVTIALYAINFLSPSTDFASNTTTSRIEELTTTPTSIPSETTTEITTTEMTTTEETTTAETTTEAITTPNPTTNRFSHLIVFLDVQRAVFFSTSADGQAIPEVSLRVSTGRVKGSTPVTPPNKPFILSGYRANQLLFTKAATWVWVRYATHVSGDIFIHSQPYDHQKDANGKTLPLDKSLFSKWGYNRLGKYTASNGCIRLSLRDAKYLSDNIYRGMPCYIFASSKGYNLPEAPENPPANLNNRWDPTDPDPMNPYVHRAEKSMAWKYKPVGRDISVKVNEEPSAVNGISNSSKLPSGTTFRFKTKPNTTTSGIIHTKIVVTYSDKSSEEVSIKITVGTPAPPTTTTTTTTTKSTTSKSSTTTTTPKPTTTTTSKTTSAATTTTEAPSATTTPKPTTTTAAEEEP